jgi:hypothetical protein
MVNVNSWEDGKFYAHIISDDYHIVCLGAMHMCKNNYNYIPWIKLMRADGGYLANKRVIPI